MSFGLKIKEEWVERNNIGVNADMEGVQFSVERLQTECMKIRSENRELKAQLIALKDDSRRVNNILDSIETKMTSVLEQMSKMNSSPSNRRKSPEEEILLNSNQKRNRNDPEEEVLTPKRKKESEMKTILLNQLRNAQLNKSMISK
jgi:septal ring factor EnvC (AmiA/AmiB activator)